MLQEQKLCDVSMSLTLRTLSSVSGLQAGGSQPT